MGKKIENRQLTSEEIKILSRVSKDPFYFSTFIWVVNPVKGRVKFDLYPYQNSVLYTWMKDRFTVVLKCRQMGITELIALRCLWLTMYHANKTVNIISIKDTIAKKVLRRIKFMYKNLPWFLQTPIVNGRTGEYGSATEMIFSNGSVIESIPTSEQAGRSESLSLLVIDEAAAVRWADEIWAAAAPTLATGGSAIINSTPLGLSTFYHRTWTDAIQGVNGFTPIRLLWDMHPDRDQAWYNAMSKALGPKRTAQEIDGDFLSSGNNVFDMADIKAIEECLSDYPVISKKLGGAYREFEEPRADKLYSIGADCATGRGTDFSSFTIMSDDGEESAVFKGKIPLDKYALFLAEQGERYNWAKIAPESNDIGIAVTLKLQDEAYPNLYYSTKLLKEKHKNKPKEEKIPGWLTTSKNRSMIIEELETDIRNQEIIVKDPFFVQEAYTFIYDNEGRPVAMGKHSYSSNANEEGIAYSDDDIFGKAITNHIRKSRSSSISIMPQ